MESCPSHSAFKPRTKWCNHLQGTQWKPFKLFICHVLCKLHTADLLAPCRASPEIAPYPFTTLMPNLGVLAASQQKADPAEDFTDTDFLLADPSGSSMGGGMSSAGGPVLADLPGLIQGAHAGRGLGRMFLRHLRRTRGLLHVIDASAGFPQTSSMSVASKQMLPAPAWKQVHSILSSLDGR